VFYQVANFSSHPQYSSITIAAVVIFNALVLVALRRSRDRVTVRLVNDPASECCCDTGKGSCH
jgi:ferrous iron transport protein B